MAANEKFKTVDETEQVKLSLKYQVLTDLTAMVGVYKQVNKT